MQLDTIEMDRNDARRAFLEYRAAVRDRHDSEDEAIMRAYRAASRGAQLIRLSAAIAAGGITTCAVPLTDWRNGRLVEIGQRPIEVPRLAVARADVLAVWTFGINRAGGCDLRYTNEWINERSRQRHRIPDGTFASDPARLRDQVFSTPRIRAMAPNIPPALRPAHHLRNYHLLWEAEWEVDRSVPARRPGAAQARGRRPVRRARRLGPHPDRAGGPRRHARAVMTAAEIWHLRHEYIHAQRRAAARHRGYHRRLRRRARRRGDRRVR